jgi:pimeloyl-ACP methyl ester carboxylesterase
MAAPASRHRDLRELRVETPAGALAGWSLGRGERGGTAPVLLVHPINLQGACWVDVAAALEPSRRALMPDLRGHGSSHAGGPFGLREWADDLLAALDAEGIESAHVVGGSLGGPLAVYLAAHHPERVRSVVAVGSALHITGDNPESVLGVLREKGVREMFREVIPQISVAPGTSQEVIERILDLANPNDAETVAEIWGATIASDVHAEAERVRCPALVVVGEHDATCTPEQGKEMADALGVRLETLPGLGHLPMLEDPAATARVVSVFLAQVD